MCSFYTLYESIDFTLKKLSFNKYNTISSQKMHIDSNYHLQFGGLQPCKPISETLRVLRWQAEMPWSNGL